MSHSPVIDHYSVCTLPLDILVNGHSVGVATGFLYQYDNAVWLVSNWHVFSGRSVKDGLVRHRSNMSPEQIEFLARDATNHELFHTQRIDLSQRGRSLWIQHKKGRHVDIAAIEFIGWEKYLLKPINTAPSVPDMRVSVADDVFVLGYPKGITMQGSIPVWKRGSIASEPDLPVDKEENVFLIDSLTREGMSGSPVIARCRGGYDDIHGGRNIDAGTFSKFLGVYSGRYGHNDKQPDEDILNTVGLGKVWGEALLIEMFRWRIRGIDPADYS